MATGKRKVTHEGKLAAEAGLHIKQNPYSTRNWMDCDLRELNDFELKTLYSKAAHWNRGYKLAALNLKSNGKESRVSI